MLTLENDQLRVEILEPGKDHYSLGPRFCSGAYIWQIHHRDRGPLMTGPHWPSEEPFISDGQGIPDVFQPTLHPADTPDGEPVLVPGVGWIHWHKHVTERRKPESLIEAAQWDWHINGNRFESRTRQQGHGKRFSLQRNIQLNSTYLQIETEIRNTELEPLHIRMFAHPFFPVPGPDGFCAMLPDGCSLPQNPGYELDGNRLLRKSGHDWKEGHFDWIYWPENKPFEILQKLPKGHMNVIANFVPSTVAVWSNHCTFSIEPFIEKVIPTGELLEYTIRYEVEG